MIERVEVDPDIMAGKPVIKGTRIPVYVILELLGEGRDTEEVLELYPDLEEEDVRAALKTTLDDDSTLLLTQQV